MEAGDSQKFADSLAEFDSMTRLDAWKTSLLLKVCGPDLKLAAHSSVRDWLDVVKLLRCEGLVCAA